MENLCFILVGLVFSCRFGFYHSLGITSINHRCLNSSSGGDFDIVCNFIPNDIQPKTRSLQLNNFADRTFRKGTFSTYSWRQVEKLEIKLDEKHNGGVEFCSLCFVGLENLEILRVNIQNFIKFFPHTLMGLNNLELLDLSGCRRFELDNLVNSIGSSDSVPKLKSLNISRLNTFRKGIYADSSFFRFISSKNIKYLDISATQLLFVNITSFLENCQSLEFINISGAIFGEVANDGFNGSCPNLRYVDASYTVFPSRVIQDFGASVDVANLTIPIMLDWLWTKSYKNVKYLDMSGVIEKRTRTSIINVTVHMFGASKYHLKVFSLRDINLDRMDLKVINPHCTLEKLDLSSCNMRFFNPGAISSCILLNWIDLSRNRLNDMMMENAELFGKLFLKLDQLRYISLATNSLSDLPRGIFENNVLAEIIDLSNNLLTKFSFETKTFQQLKLLNLTNNLIWTIDVSSLETVQHLPLVLNGNPIDCSECDSLDFIHWLLTLDSMKTYNLGLTCKNDKSKQDHIGEKVITDLQNICNRPKVIIFLCIGSVFAIVVVIIVVFTIRRHMQMRLYQLEMEDRIELIKEGAEQYTFAVFLSFSSDDYDFIEDYVYPNLNKHLQNMIGEDRELVCEGDKHFRFGRPIPEEISILIEKSSVIMVLLTDSYSASPYCRSEFDQAMMSEKPIVLMVKNHVDVSNMTLHMRNVYEKKTRKLWTHQNGEYVLKSTWENVCTSIVELVDTKK